MKEALKAMSNHGMNGAQKRRGVLGTLTCFGALCGAFLSVSPSAQADEWTDKANALYASASDAERSDLVILPLIIAMTEMPGEQALSPNFTARRSGDLRWLDVDFPRWSGWSEIDAWLQEPEQVALFAGIDTVTEEENTEKHMIFAQPYGLEAVLNTHEEFVEAGMYTELFDPPNLMTADFMYLQGVKRALMACWFETYRLELAGESDEALELALDTLRFARQIADRETTRETQFGLQWSLAAVVRIRELAFADSMRNSPSMSVDKIKEIIQRLTNSRRPHAMNLLRYPRADVFGVKQTITQAYDEGGGPNAFTFSGTIGKLGIGKHPLKLLSISAKWDPLLDRQVDWFEIMRTAENVQRDFERRWIMEEDDVFLSTKSDLDRLNERYIAVRESYDGFDSIWDYRSRIALEIAGTRTSLAVYAYKIGEQSWPRGTASIRPKYTRFLDRDPYSLSGAVPQFFVPIRDTPSGVRGAEKLFEMHLYSENSEMERVNVSLNDDYFVLYSVGPDRFDERATECTQAIEGYDEGDYLFWPPHSMLLKQFRKDTGMGSGVEG